MEKIKSTVYLTESADGWLLEQARMKGVSKSDVVQLLINETMDTASRCTAAKPGERFEQCGNVG